MALTGLGPYANTSTNSSPLPEDNSKKIRKPYTITKSRESWTEPEHDKFLEALQLFDRDWKKIEAFIGSKTVIQIRSHAQKYFQKVQKTGTNEHLPPPRPKRKTAHPYPQKASKNVLSSVLVEPGIVIRPESNSMLLSPSPASNSVQTVNMSHGSKVPIAANNCCSSTESNQRAPHCDQMYQEKNNHPLRVLPDFTQVYTFIGSVFDPNASDHLQKLKKMNPIDIETVLLLMRNLSINLTSPDFEDHRRLLSSSEIDTGPTNNVGTADKENYNDQAQTVA